MTETEISADERADPIRPVARPHIINIHDTAPLLGRDSALDAAMHGRSHLSPPLRLFRRPSFLPPRWSTFCLCVSVALAAQALLRGAGIENEFSVRQWHESDGLPHEETPQIAQDERGFLWVAGAEGLARFDGAHFENTLARETAREPLRVRTMISTANLGLVIPGDPGGVLTVKNGRVTPAPFSSAVGDRKVIALFAEASGVIWIGCADGMIFRCAKDQVKSFSAPRGLPGPRRIGFATDGRGRLWVSSDTTLLRYEADALVPQDIGAPNQELQICSSRAEGPWIATENQLLNWENGTVRVAAPLRPLLGAHYVQALLEDRAGSLWLGTRSQGLQRFARGQLQSLSGLGDEILALLEDREGNLWVGTNGAGLARVRAKTYRLFNKASGLLVDFSTAVCEDQNGDLWFANRDGGVVRWRDGHFTSTGPLPDWPTYSAVSVFPWDGGGVGFTCGSGVYHVKDPAVDQISKVSAVPAPPIVRITHRATNGEVWLAIAPDKVGRLRDEKLETFTTADGLLGDEPRSFGETRTGELLVGTSTGQLLRWDGQRFHPVSLGALSAGGAIQALYVDDEGRIWLGTERTGVLLISPGLSGVCDASRGMVQNNITQIAADDFGYLWFGSSAGVFRVSRQALLDCIKNPGTKLEPTLLGADATPNAFAGVGQYQPGVWKSHNGKLWFATRRGVLQVDPAAELAAPKPPGVVLDAAITDQGPLLADRRAELKAGVSKLEFHFAVLCLSTPERVRVRYRLEGYESEWHEAPEARSAVYSRLPAGDYVFQVAAQLADGTSSEVAQTFAVRVAPRFWQTGWFQALCLLGLIGGAAQTARVVSNRRLQKRLERAERERALERERARIARDIHDDLGASLSRISLLAEAARREVGPTHQKRLTDIYDTVSQITRSMDEIVWAVDPKHDDLDGLASYFASYAQSFLAVAGLRCRLEVPDRLPPVRLDSQKRHHLFLCIKEALNNVVRHAQATVVTLSMSLEGDVFMIRISDDGRGLAHPAEPNEAAGARTSHGHGLENMKRRMTEIGGQCEIFAGSSAGATVVFSAPVDRTSDPLRG